MKLVYFFLCLQFCMPGYGQDNKFKGRWISSESDFMFIKSGSAHVSTLLRSAPGWSNMRNDEDYKVAVIGDTLRMEKHYYLYPHEKFYIDQYDFKIFSRNDTTFSISPLSAYAQLLFQNRDTLCFRRQEYAVDSSICFEKIQYYTYYAPNNVLQIDSNRNLYIKKRVIGKDGVPTYDYYRGVLKKSQYGKLLFLLQTCNLRTLDWGRQQYTDTYDTVVAVEYNGTRKELKSGLPSPISKPLVDYLKKINRKVRLKRVYGSLDIIK